MSKQVQHDHPFPSTDWKQKKRQRLDEWCQNARIHSRSEKEKIRSGLEKLWPNLIEAHDSFDINTIIFEAFIKGLHPPPVSLIASINSYRLLMGQNEEIDTLQGFVYAAREVGFVDALHKKKFCPQDEPSMRMWCSSVFGGNAQSPHDFKREALIHGIVTFYDMLHPHPFLLTLPFINVPETKELFDDRPDWIKRSFGSIGFIQLCREWQSMKHLDDVDSNSFIMVANVDLEVDAKHMTREKQFRERWSFWQQYALMHRQIPSQFSKQLAKTYAFFTSTNTYNICDESDNYSQSENAIFEYTAVHHPHLWVQFVLSIIEAQSYMTKVTFPSPFPCFLADDTPSGKIQLTKENVKNWITEVAVCFYSGPSIDNFCHYAMMCHRAITEEIHQLLLQPLVDCLNGGRDVSSLILSFI